MSNFVAEFMIVYETMTLRELLQSVDAEACASIPLYEELLKTKPEYGSSNRIQVKALNGEIAVSRSTFGRFACKERACRFVGRHCGLSCRCGTRPSGYEDATVGCDSQRNVACLSIPVKREAA